MGPSEWRIIGKSIKGSTHLRDQKPNQDAIAWHPDESHGLPLILAVADGHGGAKYFRSHFGAQLATRTAIDVLREFAERLPENGEMPIGLDSLPAAIERQWKRAVDDHLLTNPLDDQIGEPTIPVGEDQARYLAYGTTLLSVLVTANFVVYLQLGDGDILAVSRNDDVERVIQRDSSLIANQTTSLCLPQARRHFHTQFQRIAGHPPALIILCTDGYANSFDEDGFLKAGTDFLHLIQTKGVDHVNDHLEQWLLETSQQGSGDDITVGIVAAPALELGVKEQLAAPQPDQERGSTTEDGGNSALRLIEQPIKPQYTRVINLGPLIRLQRRIRAFLYRTTGAARSIRLSNRKSAYREGRGRC